LTVNSRVISWFKSKILVCTSSGNKKDVKDTFNTNFDSNSCNYSSELCSLSEYSTNDWNGSYTNRNSTDYSSRSNGYYIISRGIQFFIDSKRQHYDVLNRYTFKRLSQLSPIPKPSVVTILPEYENLLPENQYKYQDAVLHMKKDKGNLDKDIEKYQQLFSDTNKENRENEKKIMTIMADEIAKEGYNKNNSNQTDEINGIENWSKTYLRQALKAEDIYDFTNKLDLNLQGAGVSEHAKNVIKTIITNHEILDLLSGSRTADEKLMNLSNIIKTKSASIVTAIESKDYDVDADCCPTYWSLIKRFI
jgi:hypothetical protein